MSERDIFEVNASKSTEVTTMQRSLPLVLALAILPAVAVAQYPTQYPTQYPVQNQAPYPGQPATPQSQPAPPQINSTQPIQGVWLRTDANSSAKTVSANAGGTEIRVEHGRANVQVYRAAEHAQIIVDLPGGQTSLIKDGLYTFNADTDTVSVLRGEVDAYIGAKTDAKPIKVKEDHQFSFAAGTKPVEVSPQQLAADVLPGQRGMGEGYAPGYGYGPYGDGPYGYPVAPYPYYAWGYPYYGWGFPYVGFGFYGGGFYGGGFRGGFRR
jgi:hypothetical protein